MSLLQAISTIFNLVTLGCGGLVIVSFVLVGLLSMFNLIPASVVNFLVNVMIYGTIGGAGSFFIAFTSEKLERI